MKLHPSIPKPPKTTTWDNVHSFVERLLPKECSGIEALDAISKSETGRPFERPGHTRHFVCVDGREYDAESGETFNPYPTGGGLTKSQAQMRLQALLWDGHVWFRGDWNQPETARVSVRTAEDNARAAQEAREAAERTKQAHRGHELVHIKVGDRELYLRRSEAAALEEQLKVQRLAELRQQLKELEADV